MVSIPLLSHMNYKGTAVVVCSFMAQQTVALNILACTGNQLFIQFRGHHLSGSYIPHNYGPGSVRGQANRASH